MVLVKPKNSCQTSKLNFLGTTLYVSALRVCLSWEQTWVLLKKDETLHMQEIIFPPTYGNLIKCLNINKTFLVLTAGRSTLYKTPQ